MIVSEWIAQLDERLKQGDAYNLQNMAREALETYPNEAVFHYYLGEGALTYWSFADAIAAFQRAAELAPNEPLYRHKLGMAKLKSGDMPGGEALLHELLEDNPQDVALALDLARHYVDTWQGDKAKALLGDLVQRMPDQWEPSYLLGKIWFNAELNCDEALPLANRAAELNPNDETLNLRIGINKFLKNYQACEEDFRRLLELSPGSSTHWTALALFYVEIEEFDKADQAFTSGMEIEQANGNNSYFSYQNRGDARLKAGNLSGALQDLNQAIDIYQSVYTGSPIDARLLQLRARIHQDMGNEQAAINDLLLALEGDAYNKGDIHKTLGLLYVELQEWDQAEAQFQAMSQVDSWSEAPALIELGRLALQRGSVEQAYDYWQRAREAGSYEADSLIDQHCQSILQGQQAAQDELLAQEFAAHTAANAASPFMQQLFGKYWQLDAERSLHYNLENNPFAMMLPDAMRALLLSVLDDVRPLLESVFVRFSEQTINIGTTLQLEGNPLSGLGPIPFDPSQFKGLTAYYKILKETAEFADLYAKRTGGRGDESDARNLHLLLEGDSLQIDGMGGDKPLTLFFAAKTEEQMPDFTQEQQDELFAKLKARAQEFVVTLMGSMAQGFRNIMENIDKDNDDDDAGGQAD